MTGMAGAAKSLKAAAKPMVKLARTGLPRASSPRAIRMSVAKQRSLRPAQRNSVTSGLRKSATAMANRSAAGVGRNHGGKKPKPVDSRDNHHESKARPRAEIQSRNGKARWKV